MATAISGMAQLGKTYTYDQLNRLTASQTYEDGNATTKYSTAYSYDANGNIISLSRTGNTGNMDNLTYNYTKDAAGNTLNNRLLHVNDAVATTAYTVDIDDQGSYAQNDPDAQNYGYDKIGNLIKDKAEEIAEIKWTVQGKVAEIKRTATSTKPDLLFTYDALGNRISKTVVQKTTGDVNTTYYVRDAQGNVMATYEKNSSGIALEEHYLYGSSRLGLRKPSGEKNYELTNHLGNVLAVVSDTKNADGTANVVNATDYYPFGMHMPGRTAESGGGYRYSFNGKEQDNEISGTGNTINYDARILDTRLGRFLSVDPLTAKFPMLTPYQLSSNNPILNVELDGLEGVSYRVVKKDETTGEVTAIKRVVEVDIHFAVNEKGRKGAYSTKSAEQLKTLMTTKYNEKGYLDDEGLTVEFKFNFKEFDPKTTKPTDLSRSLKSNRTPTNYSVNTWDTEGNAIVKPFESYKDVVMWKENINTQGRWSLNTIRINPTRGIYDFGHAESHELTHFMLMSTGHTIQTPNAIDDHSLGGWMQYGTRHTDGYGNTIKIEGLDFNFSQDAFKQILQSVPRVDDKVQE